MDFYSELLTQLRKGVKAEDLAAQMSKDLERAEKEHNEAMAAKRAAQEKEEKKRTARKKFAEKYSAALQEYCDAIGMDSSVFVKNDFNEGVAEALDLVEAVGSLFSAQEQDQTCKCSCKSKKSDDEVLADFINSFSKFI
jgi:hypothetical protein